MLHKIIQGARASFIAASAMALLHAAHAGDFPKDVPGSTDPAIIKRFTGSTLIGYKAEPWEAARMPVTAVINKDVQGKPFRDVVTVEGKRTRAVYLSPAGKSSLEVYRNHEQALSAARFKKKFSCEVECSDQYFALTPLEANKGLVWSRGGASPIWALASRAQRLGTQSATRREQATWSSLSSERGPQV
jgi:OOP family OmpA-OmpF porin